MKLEQNERIQFFLLKDFGLAIPGEEDLRISRRKGADRVQSEGAETEDERQMRQEG
jgi:hypothetical protein